MVEGRSRAFLLLSLGLLLIGGHVGAQVQDEESELPLCFEMNRLYMGYPLNNPVNCSNPTLCQTLCQEEESCEWFNWCSMTNRCFMKTGRGKPKDLAGSTTGPKYCSEQPSCFEMDKTYIGYPMNNPETGGSYLEECPNPQHCQLMCQEAEKCEWFSWLNVTSSETEAESGRCYMKTGKGTAKAAQGVTTGPKYCQPERNCIERNRMYIGDGLNYWNKSKNNFGRQKSEAACQDLCKRTKDCKWFNWNKDSKCFLKISHGQQIHTDVRLEEGVSTGPRECPKIPNGENCDEGWQYFNGTCYYINLKMAHGRTNSASVRHCGEKSSSLLTLQSQEEFDFISDILERNYFQWEGIDIWVDAKRASDDIGFTWQDDGAAVLGGKWREGEPATGKKCLQLIRDNLTSWGFEAEICEEEDDDGSFICEKQANQLNILDYDFLANEDEESTGEPNVEATTMT